MFTLEGFSAYNKTRFARCDHRSGKRKRADDVDCGCRLWISTQTGAIEKVVGKHNHAVEPHLVDYHKLKLRQNALQDADLTRDIGEIVRESLRGMDEAVQRLLPAVSVQRSRLQKRRMRLLKLPLEPTDMDFDIPEVLQYKK